MTIQPQYRPNPRVQPGKSGNYHRIHDALLKRADKDGVFQTTETVTKIKDELKVGFSSASSSAFQWSDPTGRRGYRRVRLYSPRKSAHCPPEMPDTPEKKTWAAGVFPKPPEVNKKGAYYISSGFKPKGETRADQLRRAITEAAPAISDHRGFWELRKMVAAMADMGFQPFSVYKMVTESLANDTMERYGRMRRMKPSVAAAVRTDPLSDPNSFKGPKTQEQINEERAPEQVPGGVKPEGIPTGDKPALDGLITQLIQKKLEQPETLSLIDTFIKKRIEEALRKQLGL